MPNKPKHPSLTVVRDELDRVHYAVQNLASPRPVASWPRPGTIAWDAMLDAAIRRMPLTEITRDTRALLDDHMRTHYALLSCGAVKP